MAVSSFWGSITVGTWEAVPGKVAHSLSSGCNMHSLLLFHLFRVYICVACMSQCLFIDFTRVFHVCASCTFTPWDSSTQLQKPRGYSSWLVGNTCFTCVILIEFTCVYVHVCVCVCVCVCFVIDHQLCVCACTCVLLHWFTHMYVHVRMCVFVSLFIGCTRVCVVLHQFYTCISYVCCFIDFTHVYVCTRVCSIFGFFFINITHVFHMYASLSIWRRCMHVMCVCFFVCFFIYFTHVFLYTCVCVFVYFFVDFTHVYVCTCVCVLYRFCVCVCTCVCALLILRVCMYAHVCWCVRVLLYQLYACVYVTVCMYTSASLSHVYVCPPIWLVHLSANIVTFCGMLWQCPAPEDPRRNLKGFAWSSGLEPLKCLQSA